MIDRLPSDGAHVNGWTKTKVKSHQIGTNGNSWARNFDETVTRDGFRKACTSIHLPEFTPCCDDIVEVLSMPNEQTPFQNDGKSNFQHLQKGDGSDTANNPNSSSRKYVFEKWNDSNCSHRNSRLVVYQTVIWYYILKKKIKEEESVSQY